MRDWLQNEQSRHSSIPLPSKDATTKKRQILQYKKERQYNYLWDHYSHHDQELPQPASAPMLTEQNGKFRYREEPTPTQAEIPPRPPVSASSRFHRIGGYHHDRRFRFLHVSIGGYHHDRQFRFLHVSISGTHPNWLRPPYKLSNTMNKTLTGDFPKQAHRTSR